MSRYDGSGVFPYEPGSNELVLANKLHIVAPEDMDLAEHDALVLMQAVSTRHLDTDFKFSEAYVKRLHLTWLGGIYDFAGQYRTENLSKGFTTFCVAEHIQTQMIQFEQELLAEHTPCQVTSDDSLAAILAEIHSRFIQIHPFREGNGRLGRWLAVLLAYQAGRPTLDFSEEMANREAYFQDLRRSFAGNLESLAERFASILRRSSA